ncbi:GNAT family N-acetyltransferase [Tissierella carlieri]|uniref:GNAT family N-acetyltransferase n=1 Tax=Tissierella carlieri TaxID=689904 RepID=A0ABT1S7E8_9FIRM|nr:GNAT family N-acetyltransferase [Tissierella carlieri]MCQ4921947.1 GNAT family N-acetyltransferase [Tissierella carlieri]
MYYTYLKNSHIEEVATIISTNYKNARLALPILSDKYENIEMHIKRIQKYIDNDDFVLAVESGKVAGFMYGFKINEFKGTAKGVLSIPSIHGIADGYDKNYLYSELYRRASDLWVNTDCYTHAMMMYANDKDAIDSWVMSGFGMLVIDAVRSLDEIIVPNTDNNILIRKVEITDLINMEYLFKGIDEHLSSTPIYLYNHINENYVDEYSNWLRTEGNMLWIAEIGNKIIGYLKTNITEINMDELDDGYTMGINGAYVLPEYRGQHIMARMLNTAADWAIENGLKRCSTDFESANIEARQFWLKHFTPYCYSMIRRIDERNHLNLISMGDK